MSSNMLPGVSVNQIPGNGPDDKNFAEERLEEDLRFAKSLTAGPWFAKHGAKAALTQRQRQVFDYIVAECEKGRFPTIRDIGRMFDIRSPNGIVCHMTALVKKGFLVNEGHHYYIRGVRWIAVDETPLASLLQQSLDKVDKMLFKENP